MINIKQNTLKKNLKRIEKNYLQSDRNKEGGFTYAVSDIHGCYSQFSELVNKIELHKKGNKLIILGDMIDRGESSYKVVKLVKELEKEYSKNKVIALKGNHEDMLVKLLEEIKANPNNRFSSFLSETEQTIIQYYKNGHNIMEDIEWFKNLPLMYEDEYFYYTHAGFKPLYSKPIPDLWVREHFIYGKNRLNKPTVFGHTPTSNILADKAEEIQEYGGYGGYGGYGEYGGYGGHGEFFEEVIDKEIAELTYGQYMRNNRVKEVNGNIAIDTGCVFSGKLSCLKVPTLEVIEIEKEDSYYEEGLIQ